MREYLEILEVLPEDADVSPVARVGGESSALQEPEFIRADITDKTDTEIASIQADIEDIMSGRAYTLQRHSCGHDEGLPCEWLERREVR